MFFAIGHFGGYYRVILWVLDLAPLVVVVDDLLGDLFIGVRLTRADEVVAAEGSTLEGYLGEECAEFVVLVLGPALEGVIMALVAVETHPEKGL